MGFVLIGLRGVFVGAAVSKIGTYLALAAALELRYQSLRQFFGFARSRLATLLPYLVALIGIVAFVNVPSWRYVTFFLAIFYALARTTWILLRGGRKGLQSEGRALAGVAGIFAVGWMFLMVFVVQHPVEWLEGGNVVALLFMLTGLFLVFPWTLFRLALAAAWIETRRAAAAAALAAAMRSREEMVAVVSHDLKSPLTSILMRLDMLIQSGSDPNVVAQAQSIRRSATTMRVMIRGLLDAASLDSGQFRLDLALNDFAALVAAVVDTVSPLAERSVKIECQFAPLPALLCDRERISQVLSNLIGNAIKFTTEGVVTIRAERRAGEILVSVADTGSGITPEVLPHIFERYFTTARGHEGTGLGLFIAKGIVEAHGGRIWATSEPGKGSTFWLTLPTRQAADDNP